MSRKDDLTAKEKAFCEAYVIDGLPANKAYLKVYECAESTANSNSYKIMKKPNVRAYIENLQKEAFDAACINAERVALKLAEIAFAGKNDEFYGAVSQLKALDLLQKQMGLQHQKIEADVSTDININIEE